MFGTLKRRQVRGARPIDAGTPETGAKQPVSTSAEWRHPSVSEQDVLLSETKK